VLAAQRIPGHPLKPSSAQLGGGEVPAATSVPPHPPLAVGSADAEAGTVVDVFEALGAVVQLAHTLAITNARTVAAVLGTVQTPEEGQADTVRVRGYYQ
jgi:hypothetical protein